MYKKRLDEYERKWLSNYTCRREGKMSVFWVSNCGRFLIMKHGGHTTYGDRMSGSGYCATYHELYDLEEEYEDSTFKKKNSKLKTWEGRWLKAYWEEVESITKEMQEIK